jgi:DNA-binding MarR family transcriptional regulator
VPPLATVVRMACRRVTRFYDSALQELGLGIGQLDILIEVDRAPGESQARLAMRLGMERSALGRALRPLERAGWLTWQAGRDRRAVRALLTPRGRATLRRGLELAGLAAGDFRRPMRARARGAILCESP